MGDGMYLYSVLFGPTQWSSSWFHYTRKRVQGDPLSPFLFIMCAEALVKSLNHAEATGCLQGISLDHDGPLVYHLLFADDSLLLCQASTNDSNELMCILQSYGEAS